MINTKEIGILGEDVAIQYLKSNGYKIISRNFKKPFGEIDIIAKSKDNIVVFFEVKALTENDFGFLPEDQMSYLKIKKLKKVCNFYILKNQNLINKINGWQIDFIAIIFKKDNSFEIKHYENI